MATGADSWHSPGPPSTLPSWKPHWVLLPACPPSQRFPRAEVTVLCLPLSPREHCEGQGCRAPPLAPVLYCEHRGCCLGGHAIHVPPQPSASASRWALVFLPGTSADPPSRAAERKGGLWERCEAQLGILGGIQPRHRCQRPCPKRSHPLLGAQVTWAKAWPLRIGCSALISPPTHNPGVVHLP